MSEESDKRHAIVRGMAPTNWDGKAASLASEIRNFLKSVADHGTNVDSGFGDGFADLWVTVNGVEFFIKLRKSNNQLANEQGSARKNDAIVDNEPLHRRQRRWLEKDMRRLFLNVGRRLIGLKPIPQRDPYPGSEQQQ